MRDKRLRSSVMLETETSRLIIDCGPDFRQQMIPQDFRKIDGILITHAHYDHMGGLDDVRPFCQFGEINVYADALAHDAMLQMLPYCFKEHRYPGVPAIRLHKIDKHQPLDIGDFHIVPFEVMHGALPILGYRIGPLTYITDMKSIADEELPYVEGTKVLVVNALRAQPHHSHQTLDDAIRFANSVGAEQTWLIHSNHDMPRHAEINAQLPPHIQMAYDGQVVDI